MGRRLPNRGVVVNLELPSTILFCGTLGDSSGGSRSGWLRVGGPVSDSGGGQEPRTGVCERGISEGFAGWH